MRPEPTNKLNPKIKSVWRISSAIILALCFVFGCLPFYAAGIFEREPFVIGLATFGTIIIAILAIALVIVFPPIRYIRWSYEVGQHELDIMRGIFWRQRFLIPFVRVQNTDTKQGPILRAFGLSSVTVSTAAGEHEIPGLSIEEADALRDLIAQQARLAQEDI